MKKLILLSAALFLLFPSALQGVNNYFAQNTAGTNSDVYGSYEAVYLTSPVTSSGDNYYGFVTLGSTLTIAASSQANWFSIGKMLSTIIFSNSSSTLYLGGCGMRCGSLFGLTGPGIIGVDSVEGIGPATMWLTGDLSIGQVFTLSYNFSSHNANDPAPGQLIIDGGGRTVTIASGGQFVINAGDLDTSVAGASLKLQNMNLVIATRTPFVFHNGNAQSKLILQDVNVYLDPSLAGNAVNFDNSGSSYGALTIKGNVTITGPGQSFNYNSNTVANTSNSSIYIDDNSTLTINPGVTFQLDCDNFVRNSKIYLKGTSSTLMLNNCTFSLPTSESYPGVQLERGNVIFDNRVKIANGTNTVAHNGLVLGDGVTASNDVAVKVCSGAQVIVSGFLFHNPA